MWAVFINNLSEIVLGIVYTGVILTAGYKLGKWRLADLAEFHQRGS